jgi:hypothetical protein
MNTFSRIALLLPLTLGGMAFSATPAPRPNTHTVTVNGKTQTYANLPGAPVSSDAGSAYQFRTRVSGSPQCSRFAEEADAVFLNSGLSNEEKATALQSIGGAAQSAQCLNP